MMALPGYVKSVYITTQANEDEQHQAPRSITQGIEQ
jgi:hypothetical protein